MSTAMGPLTIMIEALTGVVIFNPSKKNNWFAVTPKAAQISSLSTSFLGMFLMRSFPEKGKSIQNSRAAPVTRN